MFEEALHVVITEYQNIKPMAFWVCMLGAAVCAYLIYEASDRMIYGILAFPYLATAGLIGHAVFERTGYKLGVDPITDAIVGMVYGMCMALLLFVAVNRSVAMFAERR